MLTPRLRATSLLLLLASVVVACDQQSIGSSPTATAPPNALIQCSLLQPLWGDAPCPALTRAECQAVNWTGSVPSEPKNPACFGFFEDISNCPACNILSISDYTPCRNKQYVDCLLDGYLDDRSGQLCFVTPLSAIKLVGQVRITARELCYYRQRIGTDPPACSSQCLSPILTDRAARGCLLPSPDQD